MVGSRGARARAVVSIAVIVLVTLAATLPAAVAQDEAQDVPLASWTPLPAAADVEVSAEAQEARARLLGPHALDPAHVTLSWVGVSSFVVTIGGHLLLFDAWEIVGIHADVLPLGRGDLAALEPEAILVGHGHFDHAADVGYVAGLTGAAVVGSQEICDRAREDARYDGVPDDFPCAITGTGADPPPGVSQELRLFADLEPITVLQHVHSAAQPPGEDNQPQPFAPVFDPAPYLENPNLDPDELARFIRSLGAPQGGTWLYHLRAGDFTLLLGDSAGPIYDYPAVQEALDSFPGCVDVMANAILGFNQPVSGLKDPRLYVQHVKPKVFLPTHADAWAPGVSAGQEAYREELAREFESLEHPPEVDYLLDPDDYLAERAYRVADERWAEPSPGSSCAAAAGTSGPVDGPVEPADPAAALPATGGAAPLLALVLLAGLATARSTGARRTRRSPPARTPARSRWP